MRKNSQKQSSAVTQKDLIVHHQMTEVGYISAGDDPQFLIQRELNKGWYSLEYLVNFQGEDDIAKIYIDYGDGFNEQDVIFLPIHLGRMARRVIYLTKNVKLMRFDPLECEGSFVIKSFVIKEIPLRFAFYRILKNQQFNNQSSVRLYLQSLFYSLLATNAKQNKLYLEYNNSFEKKLPVGSYNKWISKNEKYLSPAIINANIAQFKYRPLFSIVMPTYNTEESFLCAALESVLAQNYPYWELCIADDCSTNPQVCKILQHYANNDARIHYMRRDVNGHISAASNSALQLATGDYVVLMDHDDTLAKNALYEVTSLLAQNPALKIIYSDEDKINLEGIRADPHFKSDWNRDLLYSQNYINHLGVYQRALLKKIDGFRIGFEGSQDYDLLLRCLLHVTDNEIAHIPKILYHWRITEGSTALRSDEKSYTTEAGIKALTDYFKTQKLNVRVESHLPNMYRLRWILPTKKPLVSLIIPTRDGYEILQQCINSILEKTTYKSYEILIVDNDSRCEKTLAYLKQCSRKKNIRVLSYPHPFNYSAINNYAVKQARGEIIGLINNDIEVISPDWLTEMVSQAMRPDIGCVGAKLYYANDTIQHAGVICGLGGVAGHSHKYFPRNAPGYFYRLHLVQNLLAVTGAALLVKKAVFVKVGGLNEVDLKIAFNDVDFCLRVYQAGYRNIWTPFAELYHHESVSRGAEDNPEKIARFNSEADYMRTTWADILARDPFYNPNLTLAHEDFSIRFN